MRKFLHQLWKDEHGFVISSELVFVATILVIGMVTGLSTVREQVLGELGDVADAISEIDQSYAYSAVTGHASSTAGVVFFDQNDFCEGAGPNDQNPGTGLPQCLNIVAPAGGEAT